MSLILSADPPEISAISARNRVFWRGPLRAALLYCGLSAGLTVALFTAAALVTPTGRSPVRSEPGPLPGSPWIDIVRPFQIYALSSEFGREPTTFEAQRHREGGGRLDTLTWGNLNSDSTPYLRIALHRVGRESAEDSSFFVQMVRQAALFGAAVTRGGVSDALATRFGTFETADLALDTGQTSTSCLGFRFASDTPALRISGFACGTPARPVDRQTLACTLDRLDLVLSGDDQELGRFFAAAETRRDPRCAPGRNHQASWMDGAAPAPLRGVARKTRSAR
ncbi:hypothetical protein PY365_12985 [Roseiarcaceae bacterium H3SJ34-1]|uniref:hypothetical protein n=1 Tax=Terripilifer ovatus TaxID=3032367 RepID=UPI003AB99669|nr:hypothetical protein [Roseiarcaceae bacterium H3SJ34-1]